MEGKVISRGYYNGQKVVRTELRDTFRATTVWESLGAVPKEAIEWDIINESSSKDIDVSFQEEPDPTAPPYQTLESGGGSPSRLDPGDWRPSMLHIRGTSGEGYFFYFIIAEQNYSDGDSTYQDALREEQEEIP